MVYSFHDCSFTVQISLFKEIANMFPFSALPLLLQRSDGPDQMFAWGFKEKGYYVIKKAIGPDFWFLFCCQRHVGQAFFHDQTCKIILFLELGQFVHRSNTYCHISPINYFSKFYSLFFIILLCTSTETFHLLTEIRVISYLLFWSGKLKKDS